MDLPHRLCVLDVETVETVFARPERSKLALAGVKLYELQDGSYDGLYYRYYLADEVRELEKLLRGLHGPVLGHNILPFDYRVLRPLLSLEGIVGKTVDLLAFLREKNGGRFAGLSLKSLSEVNLQAGKSLDGAAIPELWRRGKRDVVIEYNENDCSLTKELWWRLVSTGSLRVSYYNKELGQEVEKELTASQEDFPCLFGEKPLLTFKEWEEKIDRNGYVFRR